MSGGNNTRDTRANQGRRFFIRGLRCIHLRACSEWHFVTHSRRIVLVYMDYMLWCTVNYDGIAILNFIAENYTVFFFKFILLV